MKNLSNNPNGGIANKGGRPVQEERKDKILSIRVDHGTYALLEDLRIKMGYKSLSAFIVDMLLTKADSPKKYTPFNPDIERLFCDVEAAMQYGLRLEKRAENFVDKDIVEDLQGEIQHFKIFIARKAEVLLDRVRDEHFNQKRS